jgi:hypothetical protein
VGTNFHSALNSRALNGIFSRSFNFATFKCHKIRNSHLNDGFPLHAIEYVLNSPTRLLKRSSHLNRKPQKKDKQINKVHAFSNCQYFVSQWPTFICELFWRMSHQPWMNFRYASISHGIIFAMRQFCPPTLYSQRELEYPANLINKILKASIIHEEKTKPKENTAVSDFFYDSHR